MVRLVSALAFVVLAGCARGPVLLRIRTQPGTTYRTTTIVASEGQPEKRRMAETVVDAVDRTGVITLRTEALGVDGPRDGSAMDLRAPRSLHVNARGQIVDVAGDDTRMVLARDAWPDAAVSVGSTWDTESVARTGPAVQPIGYVFCETRWTLVAIDGDTRTGIAVIDGASSCELDGAPGRRERTHIVARVSVADALVGERRTELLEGDRVVGVTDVHVERVRR